MSTPAPLSTAPKADVLRLLEETSLEGYTVMCDPTWARLAGLAGRVLSTERALRARAEELGIDLAPYPNADLAERTLGA
jgi:hypothetical protein